jgi:putative PIG3 family NAD(P)H quinone oxidoreductase
MRAVIITTFGGPEVLDVRDVPVPVPRAREIRVRVRATALNRADVVQRMGRYAPPNDAPRDIPGIEFAGEVDAVGPEARRWAPGQRVFGLVGGGGHAEYVVTHEDTVARVPDRLGWRDAAAVPEAFITAYDALVTQAGLASGEIVLILAVGSGVGLAAIQVVRAWGGIPYGTSRTLEKVERALELGLEEGVTLPHGPDGLVAAVQQWTGQRGAHVVLDLLGGPYVTPAVDCLAPRGRMMLVGAVAGAQATIDVRRILGKRVTLRGTVLRSRSLEEKIDVTRRFAADVVPRVATGELRPVIDSVFPIDRIADAHRRMESNETFGKVVVEV